MDELIVSRGDESQGITIKRGGQNITLKKAPNAFAVRLKRGMATSESALESSLGQPKTAVTHVESDAPQRLDVFRLETAGKLEDTMDELRKAPNADVITHLYTIDDAVGAEVIPTGTMTLQFKPDTAKSRQEEILKAYGLEVIKEIDFLPDGLLVRVTSASTENPLKIAARLQQREELIVAEPDLRVPPAWGHTPTDTLYREQWHLKNRGDKVGLIAGADVKAEEAWEITRGTRNVTICIIDDGFDLGHPDFRPSDKIVAPRDFGQNDQDPRPVSIDDNHGTACAGIALAEENGSGVVGLAPGCAFMPIRFESISDQAIEDYFSWAVDHGADVISCSWGAAAPNYPLSALQRGIIHKAATEGRQGKGCVILFAAGNESAPLNGGGYYNGFALHPDVIAVAASNSIDEHSNYSNHGREIAICAPSSGSPGWAIVTTDRRGFNGYNVNADYTSTFGGTSSATPLAAGLAALMLSVNPELTAAQVKQIMMETADKIDSAGGQYDANGHSTLYGHGRINAYRAVQRARQMLSDVDRTQPDTGETAPSSSRADVQLEIVSVELSQFEPTSIILEKLLEVKTNFRISGADSVAAATNETRYRVDVRIVNLESGQTNLVATKADTLQPQTFLYTSRSRFGYPEIGRYELRSQVVLQLPSGEVEKEFTSSTTLIVTS
jgi:subtilisin family serine protease